MLSMEKESLEDVDDRTAEFAFMMLEVVSLGDEQALNSGLLVRLSVDSSDVMS